MLKPQVEIQTPQEMMMLLARRCKELRLFREYSRKTLARMSGVSEASIKRFEVTGQISLESLLKIAFVLDALTAFGSLCELPPAKSLAELEKWTTVRLPKRGRR